MDVYFMVAIMDSMKILCSGVVTSPNWYPNECRPVHQWRRSVWLNNLFLGMSFGSSTNNRNILETDDKFIFLSVVVHATDIAIIIVQA
ncbi:putative beta-galactosidase A [Mycena venus]|uniref:Putative beta-galactosidase A n=1 Tax=Mycena venus TaxID=2733690 RepID=A0A8H6Z3F9_9AGAR|nr:putative beta-galactosidase A [Mycena venus]